jgi:hypothetical protein
MDGMLVVAVCWFIQTSLSITEIATYQKVSISRQPNIKREKNGGKKKQKSKRKLNIGMCFLSPNKWVFGTNFVGF